MKAKFARGSRHVHSLEAMSEEEKRAGDEFSGSLIIAKCVKDWLT
jgi:hypothetical protein